MRNGIFVFLFILLTHNYSISAEGDLIVRFKDPTKLQMFTQLMGMSVEKIISSDLQIALVSPQLHILDNKKVLGLLNKNSNILWAQEDHPISRRGYFNDVIPNDPNFSAQWALHSPNADIRATKAWTLGQGGQTRYGEDIVIAVVDDGVDYSHPNLEGNIWINHDEVPDNGIDDDGNGYIDDIFGWDSRYNKGHINPGFHGTHVAGILGASGNNGLQTTGVNWNVQIMTLAALGGGSNFSSSVLGAYAYALKQKRLWLESGGERGANVVVTNSSFGVDFADCESWEYPAWNDMYNALGEAGILSVAATINSEVNVDERGDVPTTCSSPFIISVTNTTSSGQKFRSAGFGKRSIDLGAPGTSILSTVPRGGIENATGTSMSAPHVAGAVAFMHSVASFSLLDFYHTEPSQAALTLKSIMLETVTPQDDLSGVTVSGGRLNLYAAALKAANY